MSGKILYLLVLINFKKVLAFGNCCEEENIIVNGSCLNGANITVLSCAVRILMGPTQLIPVSLEIDSDNNLLVTEDEEVGHFIIKPDKYCIIKESENDTNSVLVCGDEEEEEVLTDITDMVFYYLKIVCAFISVMFLLIIFVIYVFTPGLQDIEGICIIQVIASHTVATTLILFTPAFILMDPYPCDSLSFIFYTAHLSSNNWISVLSFHLWRITIHPIFQTHMNWILLYCLYGYGIPLLLILTAVINYNLLDTDLTTGETQCLIDMGSMLIYAYFYGPMIIMILLSLILQLWVAKKVWIDINDTSQSVNRLRKKSLMYGHLLLVLVTCFILDAISYNTMSINMHLDYFWHLCDCRGLLVGAVLFFIFVILRNKVLKALAKKGLFCIKFPEKWKKLTDEESEHIETEETALTKDSTGF